MDEVKTNKKKGKSMKLLTVLIVIGLIIVAFVTIGRVSFMKNNYLQASEVMADADLTPEKINNALNLLNSISGYQDSNEKINEIIEVAKTMLDDAIESKNFETANSLLAIEDVKNAVDYDFYSAYLQASEVMDDENLTSEKINNALCLMKDFSDYTSGEEKISEIVEIANAMLDTAVESKNFEEAKNLLDIEDVKKSIDFDSYNTYIKAVEKESESVVEAYNLYKQISEDFFNTKNRMDFIEEFLSYEGTYKIKEISGTWYSSYSGNKVSSAKETPELSIDVNIIVVDGAICATFDATDINRHTTSNEVYLYVIKESICKLYGDQNHYTGYDYNNTFDGESDYLMIFLDEDGMTLNQYVNNGISYAVVAANFDKVEKEEN